MARPTQDQIDDVINKVYDHLDAGTSAFPGMSYEEGVRAAIDWMTGDTLENPMED
jgi:hypothetical protein